MLKSIVALLLSFACLAERLSAAPGSVRGLVLAILARAETIARAFVVGMARDHGIPARFPASRAMAAICPGDSRADAMRLAQIFRALAVLLARLANRNSCDDRRSKFAADAAAGRPATALDPAGAISSLLVEAGTSQFGPPAPCFPVERIDSS